MDSKLKRRIVTGLVLAPLAVSAVFFLPNLPFAVLFAGITALAMYEWAGFVVANMYGSEHSQGPFIPMLFVAVFVSGAVWLYITPAWQMPVMYAGLVLWVAALFALRFSRMGFNPFATTPSLVLTGLIMGWAGWLGITLIHALPDGHWWILWVFGIAWGADVGAYFAGKAYGRTKLAPQISPGKTWEGVGGGLALAGTVCGLGVFFWQDQSWLWLILTFVLIGLSVCGDLFESLIKRQTGVKDSGTVLPGHGGMLDRIDSILIILPVLAVLLTKSA